MRRSDPRTNPSRQCHRHDCAGTSSSPGTAVLSYAAILADAGLPIVDAQLEQFAMNARRISTMGWQCSVHSVLCEWLGFGNVSVPAQRRMDNLLKVHS
jgi:hypothetical protein